MQELAALPFLGLLILVIGYQFMKGYNEAGRQRGITLSGVDAMSGVEFEAYVAELLRNEGFSGIKMTKVTGDFGVDIVAAKGRSKYAIQVKRYQGSVSRSAVSDAVAGKKHYGCDAAMVITNSYLTKQAREFAASVDCAVVDRDVLGSWISRFGTGSKS